MTERPLRFCDVCGELDDHPRHVVQLRSDETSGRPSDEFLAGLKMGDAPITAVEQLTKGDVRVRHLNCCAEQGCAVCQATEKVTKGARGQKLTDALVGGTLAGFEAPDMTEGSD